MEIRQTISDPPPIQDQQLARYLKTELSRMQQEIYLLRQFLEPAIKLTNNTPKQTFNPLE